METNVRTPENWELMSKKFTDCTPGATLEILSGTNHKDPLEKVKGFSELIIEFVDENR